MRICDNLWFCFYDDNVKTSTRLVAVAIGAMATVLPAAAQSSRPKPPARLTVAAEPPATVVAGKPFSLALRLAPLPGIHVYAPGNPNYIPVDVEISATTDASADVIERLLMTTERFCVVGQSLAAPPRLSFHRV